MTGASVLALLSLLAPVAGGLAAAVLGYRQVVKVAERQAQTALDTARDAATATPYGAMVERVAQQDARIDQLAERAEKLSHIVTRLERRIEQQDDDLNVLTDALWAQHEWQRRGSKGPAPLIASEALRLMHDRRNGRSRPDPEPEDEATP